MPRPCGGAAAEPGDSIRRHSRSFSFANRLLPAARREAVERLYAWCRWCDDGVDAAPEPEAAVAFLDEAERDLRRIAAGSRPSAIESRWLAAILERYELPIEAAEALVAGMRSDLTPAADLSEDDLFRYCFRVAGAVGVLMCPILGLGDRRYLPHAAALGMAMQLTNIARDVAEDWGRSRCYLPVAWTDGLKPGRAPLEPDPVGRAVERLLLVADGYYAAGEAGIDALDRGSRLAVRTASRVYQAIGTEIRRRRFRVLEGRARVSTGRKLWLFLRSCWSTVGGGRPIALTDAAADALLTAARLLREHGVACQDPVPREGMAWQPAGGPDQSGASGSFPSRSRQPEPSGPIPSGRLSPECAEPIMKADAWGLVFTGLSLTSVTATALFIMMAFNPKDTAYGGAPLFYAGGSAVLAIAFNRAAAWAARR